MKGCVFLCKIEKKGRDFPMPDAMRTCEDIVFTSTVAQEGSGTVKLNNNIQYKWHANRRKGKKNLQTMYVVIIHHHL